MRYLRQKFRKCCVEKLKNFLTIQTNTPSEIDQSGTTAAVMKIRPIIRHKEYADQDTQPSGLGTVRLAAIVSRRGKKVPFSPTENCRPAPSGEQHA